MVPVSIDPVYIFVFKIQSFWSERTCSELNFYFIVTSTCFIQQLILLNL